MYFKYEISFTESCNTTQKCLAIKYCPKLYDEMVALERAASIITVTGKSLSEAFILTSVNPQYDKRLFMDLPVQYMKTTSPEQFMYINCSECQNKNKKQFVCTTCSPHVLSL